MGDHDRDKCVSIPICVVLNILIIEWFNGRNTMLLELLFNGCLCFEFFEVMIVCTVGRCDLCCSASGGMKCLDARMICPSECVAIPKNVGRGGYYDTNSNLGILPCWGRPGLK